MTDVDFAVLHAYLTEKLREEHSGIVEMTEYRDKYPAAAYILNPLLLNEDRECNALTLAIADLEKLQKKYTDATFLPGLHTFLLEQHDKASKALAFLRENLEKHPEHATSLVKLISAQEEYLASIESDLRDIRK